MNKKGPFKLIVFLLFLVFFSFTTVASEGEDSVINATQGTIKICKIIVDFDGNIVNGTDTPGLNFTVISFIPENTTGPPPAGTFPNVTFTTPLKLKNDVLLCDAIKDAWCHKVGPLPLGAYYYAEEIIPPGWDEPLYNDSVRGMINSFDELHEYDSNLFDGNSTNDSLRNFDADGLIVLTSDRRSRTLLILNKQKPLCGNSILDPGEQCDDGNTVSGDGCSAICELEFCGDNIVQPGLGEQCDDGNNVGGDGCSAQCKIEICGNAILDPGEECDDGNLVSGDGCTSLCELEFCGDSVTQPGLGEECDDGNNINEDGCSSLCKNEFCGDNVVQIGLGEQCDDGNNVNGDGCSAQCKLEFCGNGVVDPGEQCDDGNNVNGDGCSDTCKLEKAFLTVIKIVINDNGGSKTVNDFPLFVDNVSVTSGVAKKVMPSVHVVSEVQQPGYAATISGDCSPSGIVNISFGQNKTCIITNNDLSSRFIVIKHVINDNGGVAVAANFMINVTDKNTKISLVFPGSEGGALLTLNATNYSITETGPSGYAANFSADCSGSVGLNETRTCIITNDDIPAKLTVIKHVINDDGGNATASDFNISVILCVSFPGGGGCGAPAPFPGSETGTNVSLNAGSYSVNETGPSGYAVNFSSDCSGSISIGQNKTCVITNDDIPSICEDNETPSTEKIYRDPFFSNGTSDWITSLTFIEFETTDEFLCPGNSTKTFYRVTLVDDENCRNDELCQGLSGSGPWLEFLAPFTIQEESCHLIEFFANDTAGNQETVKKQCTFVDNKEPAANKTVGKPRLIWNGNDANFYNISEKCWSNSSDSIECWKTTMDTPITFTCTDQEPHPVNNEQVCFNVNLDNEDATQDYCEEFGGEIQDNDFCCVFTDNGSFTFHFLEESEHNLAFYCQDALGHSSSKDHEKFKVIGRSFNITLNKKWNLISTPFVLLDSDPDVVFEDIKDKIISVSTYDNATWFVWTPDDATDTIDKIVPGWGYWVLMNKSNALLLGGSLFTAAAIPPSKNLSAGWNLIGYYGNEDEGGNDIFVYNGPVGAGKPALCSLASLVDTTLGLPKWASLLTYWEPFNPDSWVELDFVDKMDPGAGYWIEINENDLYSFATTCPLLL